MVKQAEEFASRDKERAEVIEARNHAESLAYEAERVLNEQKEKIDAAEAERVRGLVKELRDLVAQKEASASALRTKSDELTKALHGIAQKMYQSAGASGAGPAPPPPPPGDATDPGPGTGPVDADFKVVDDPPNGGTAS